MTKPKKPLGGPAYGSIPHLPGSRRGPSDGGLSEQQARILLSETRDRLDIVTVSEKLDGSNVSVALHRGEIIPLTRAGYRATDSPFPQHYFFHRWVMKREDRFRALLNEGERVVGEWLIQAHGTRYALPHEPFVVFDIMEGKERRPYVSLCLRAQPDFVLPKLLFRGSSGFSIEKALEGIEVSGHGAVDPVEGAVWRVERKGKVDFLGKYVRPGKVDGCYLEQKNGWGMPMWNCFVPGPGVFPDHVKLSQPLFP